MDATARRYELTFDPAALLALKLLAFGVMIADHADMFFGTGQGVHALVGRIVFPIFGIVFAFNLARMAEKKVEQLATRLLAIGAASQLLYAYLQGAWLPINVLVSLALAALMFGAINRRAWLLGLAAFGLSPFVDYSMWGVCGIVGMAIAFRDGAAWQKHCAVFGFVLSLGLTNGTQWALLALPIVYVAAAVRAGAAPRLKWLFYVGYPVHLLVLAIFKLGG